MAALRASKLTALRADVCFWERMTVGLRPRLENAGPTGPINTARRAWKLGPTAPENEAPTGLHHGLNRRPQSSVVAGGSRAGYRRKNALSLTKCSAVSRVILPAW
jgi:hypothetical protein